MKKYVKANITSESKDFILQSKSEIVAKLDEALDILHEMCMSTGGDLQEKLSTAYNDAEDLATFINETVDKFYGIAESTQIEADSDNLPKGYYDEYYGQTAFEEYGDLVSEECSGMIISKRASEGEEPGGLIYEANRLGIDDFFDLLKCLEGMCYNGTAVEISDYQYKVL